MKFLHTGDLHIGKVLHEMSLLEDQKYILKEIVKIAEQEKVDAVVVAGDVYDRSIPAVEAVSLLDEFLTDLSERNIMVLIISGNHDSGERLSFMNTVLEKQKIFIAGNSTENLSKIEWKKDGEQITFVLFPFIKPAQVGAKSSDEAVRLVLEREGLSGENKEKDHKYVLITHFFVTDGGKTPELSDSESPVHVGGIDNVEASAFSFFDYVALGHIHKPQKIGEREVYYAGTPLKYSFSEAAQEKSVVLIEIGKEEQSVKRIPLKPLRDMRKIRGSLQELMKPEITALADTNDYIQAVLTDKEELIDPIGTLRTVYPNVMQIILEKNEVKTKTTTNRAEQISQKSALELFEEFFELLRGEKMDEARREEVRKALEE
ncbi:MAG: exonuclease SbcCD subunit D [Lachnospiraceae bacterium]|nr:exonuclease SbcCD subunit D [Lachnospiraceae bacterium]